MRIGNVFIYLLKGKVQIILISIFKLIWVAFNIFIVDSYGSDIWHSFEI